MKNGRAIFGDCLQQMAIMEHHSIDMVFCDLPYGTTYANWDKAIDMSLFWRRLLPLVKHNAALLFTASQPFTSRLITSNPSMFRTEWIWDKANPTNFANAKKHPMKVHESIIVFSKEKSVYFPIMTPGAPNHVQGKSNSNSSETRLIVNRSIDDISGMKYPKSIVRFPKHSSQLGLHSTQKPVDMVRYFIETYSVHGNVVLDCCAGSFTTAIACIDVGRKFVCIENDRKHFDVGVDRVRKRLSNAT